MRLLSRSFCDRLNLEVPIVLAPMLGHGTPQLAAAVTNAGGLGNWGAGFLNGDALRKAVQETRRNLENGKNMFGVNLFLPECSHFDVQRWSTSQSQTAQSLRKKQTEILRSALGANSVASEESIDDFDFDSAAQAANLEAQLQAIAEEKVPLVSFHFGWPSAKQIDWLRTSTIGYSPFLVGNATTVEEAIFLAVAGADAIVAQGREAAGHRGTFLKVCEDGRWKSGGGAELRDSHHLTSVELVNKIREALLRQSDREKPHIIAAGGIMDGRDIHQVLDAGASAAQLGTAFLVTDECGTSQMHRDALLQKSHARNMLSISEDSHNVPPGVESTFVTKVYTGRPARGLRFRNGIAGELHDALNHELPSCFNASPLGRRLQAEAVKAGRADLLYMWAGTGWRKCRYRRRDENRPETYYTAAELVGQLEREMEEAQGT